MIIKNKFNGYSRDGLRLYPGSDSAGSPTSQSITQTSIPDYARPYVEEMLGKNAALISQDYQTYGGQRIAGFDPMQLQAQQAAANLGPSRQLGTATQMAGLAGLNAGKMQYSPTTFNTDFREPDAYKNTTFTNQFTAPTEYSPTTMSSYDASAAQLGTNPTATAEKLGANPQAVAAAMQAQQMGASPQAVAALMQAASFKGPEDIGFERVNPFTQAGGSMSAAQMMGPEGVSGFGGGTKAAATKSFTDQGTAAQYMSPYTQNVTDIQTREAQRAADIAATQRGAQAAQQGAFGGSRQAIMEAEAARNLAQQKGDITAKGQQSAYEQAMQQFNAEQGYGLTAQQANLQAGLQSALANQQAGLTVGTQNLSAAQQANVQNLAAQLQTQGLNAQQAMQAALANQQSGLTAGQFNATMDYNTSLQNAQLQQQAAMANQQAQQQTALANQSMAGQYGMQQGQFGQQAAVTNQQAQQQAALANQSMAGQYGLQQGQFGQQAALANQALAGQYGIQQGQFGQQTALANQQAKLAAQQAQEQSKQYGAGLGMTAAQQKAQYGLAAQQASEQSKQYGYGQLMTSAQQDAQYRLADKQASEQSKQFGANLGLQGIQQQLAAAGTLGQLGQTQFGQQKDIINAQANAGAQRQAQQQQKLTQDYADFQRQQQYPYQQLSYMSDMLRGLPMSQSTQSIYAAPPSALSQLGGAALVGKGAGLFKKGGAVKASKKSAGLAALALKRMG